MTKEREYAQNVTEIDCALIMMLDEERDRFIKHNRHLIIGNPDSSGFVEFTFFDKAGKLRKGIIYSCGKKMGNTEACKLFYKFSRHYRAHLYINMGVAGYFNDINIGDVLFADRLSTLSEDNALNELWQTTDGPFSAKLPSFPQSFLDSFAEESKRRLCHFHKELKRCCISDEENIKKLPEVDVNVIKSGRCLTVPEVIKGDINHEDSRFPRIRKGNVVDMEAYYLFDWYELIEEQEPWRSVENSSFLVFKSVSDMADENKALVERCGSRDLAMANLCDVVCTYLTDVHTFRRETEQTISTYFQSEICHQSLDSLFSKTSTAEKIKAFGNFCRYFITTDSVEGFILNEDCVKAACDFLSVPQKTLLLTGHSGTGKSTFISYVFDTIRKERTAILVDFSKFTSTTTPTDTQIVYLFERLLAHESAITVFLDGVNITSKTYNALLSAIKRGTYVNLSLCIGDISDAQLAGISTRNPLDLLPPNTTVVTYSFGGLSIYSPQLDSMIDNAKIYFDSDGNLLNKDIILEFILTSGLSHVDFRLLKMIADYGKSLEKKKDFYGFIDWYCAKKVGRSTISSLYSYIPFTLNQNKQLSDEQQHAYHILSQNSYTRAFLFANCIVEIVIGNNPKIMEELLKSDYLLSNDMNLFLELKLKKDGKMRNDFVQHLLSYLSKPSESINLSSQTQLIYNIFHIQDIHSHNLKKQRRNLLQKQAQVAEENCKKTQSAGEDYYDWSIQYRTLAILMWCKLDKNERKREFLDRYNLLLLEDKDTRCYNLSFHLYYYSQREFTFEQVNTFETRNVTDEMVFNTYYNLMYCLRSEILADINNANDPFVSHNIITFAHLIQDVLMPFERFSLLTSQICETLANLITSLQRWPHSSIQTPVTSSQLTELLIGILKTLKE